MKYKKLTKEQILISLDRLTRFKNTKDKYKRVFFDIILSNLIEPKFKKSDLENLPSSQLKQYVEEIFNSSFGTGTVDNSINKKLANYEKTIFELDDYTTELLNNMINIKEAIKLVDDTSAVNLQWLKSLTLATDLTENREKKCLKFPIEKVLLVEGLTEETLLPAFSRFLGHDFYREGIQIIPAGGKNQVVKLYYTLSKELKIPIFLLLDKDAEDNIKQIEPRLRKIDKIHLVSCGEFEDLLPKQLIVKTVNNHLNNFASINQNEIDDELSNVENLENIFKEKGLHEFKKAEFAKLVRDNIKEPSDISDEIKEIISELFLC